MRGRQTVPLMGGCVTGNSEMGSEYGESRRRMGMVMVGVVVVVVVPWVKAAAVPYAPSTHRAECDRSS